MIRLKQWLSLFGCFLLVIVFIFFIAPFSMRIDAVQELADYIDDNDIEATALWWSEVGVVADAEMNCRNTVEYPPRASGKRK